MKLYAKLTPSREHPTLIELGTMKGDNVERSLVVAHPWAVWTVNKMLRGLTAALIYIASCLNK